MRTTIILTLFMAILAVATAFHCDSGEFIADSLKCDGYDDCECGCDEHGCGTGCVGGSAEGCFDEQGNPTGLVNTGSSFANRLLSRGGSSGNNQGGSRTNSFNGNGGGFSSSGGSCKNLEPDCDEWQKDVHCESDRYMDDTAENRRKGIAGMQMIKVCAKSCNFNNCGGRSSGNNGGGSRTNSFNGNSGGFSSSRGSCENLDSSCDEWQIDTHCESWRYMDDNAENRRKGYAGKQMIEVCARSCNFKNCVSGGNSQYGENRGGGGGVSYGGNSGSGGGGSYGGNRGGGGGGSYGGNRGGGGQAPKCGKGSGRHFTNNGCIYECDGNIRGSGTCATEKSGTCGSCFGQDWGGGSCDGEPSGCPSCKNVC